MKRQLQIIFPSKYIYYYHSAFNYLLILCRTEKILINSGVAIAPPPKSVKKATAKSSAAANLSAASPTSMTMTNNGLPHHPRQQQQQQRFATSPTSTTMMTWVTLQPLSRRTMAMTTLSPPRVSASPSLYLFPSCTLCHKLILLLPFFILLKSLHISYQMNMESIYFYW